MEEYGMLFNLSNRSAKRMDGVHPLLVSCVCLALKILVCTDFGVGAGAVRTEKQQRDLVENGFSKTMNSKHLPQEDGFSHAIDLYPSGYKTIEEIPEEAWVNVKTSMSEAANILKIKIECGYDWGWDKPHHQIKEIIQEI